jgi:hypothetical protein
MRGNYHGKAVALLFPNLEIKALRPVKTEFAKVGKLRYASHSLLLSLATFIRRSIDLPGDRKRTTAEKFR